MPLYDYRCVSCGDFREIRPMTESRAPRLCPVCGASSERVIAAPFLAGGQPSGGTAHQPIGARHACGHGCGHSH